MSSNLPAITGIGSVSPYGTLTGAIDPRPLQPRLITAWPVAGVRRAYLVEPFRPTDVAPGLKTRRLDRLSVWALVAASLAVKDAGLELDLVDRSRVGVVCATGLGCIELTEAFLESAADNGWAQTDPIIFPETLGNAPASHVARCLELRGPNITVNSKGEGGECALLQAASLVRHRQADLAVVIAGDTLTRTSYEWYEAAGRLSSACFSMEPATEGCGFIPGEAVTAMVLESADSPRAKRPYARLRRGHLAAGPADRSLTVAARSGGEPAAIIRKTVEGLLPGHAIRCYAVHPSVESAATEAGATVVATGNVGRGLGDTGALLRLAIALHAAPAGTLLLLTGAPSHRGFATLLLEAA